ncbi:hypothetical protein KO507_15080 [Gilvimarinus agarilyticus]|uniref:hypothetical protein n=1 Tax=unclassified Gilvimarinus TaxID=2642066 RepID=UPI001C0A2D0F|nr:MULTISPECIES: hypothetical protein [unclassified Gilvimarinus]MBU2887091.1 hypothetical protein [Gilvimarinus agarilyticus]MDO6571750.1 hypothetical protein [Gilvimarinus sp. 2_MG-2023]MDO6745822.1 hypothetical protein [Gilvimarinus sp. 1_MG-2023]
MKLLIGLMSVLLVAACSNRAVYENVQHNQHQLCDREPPGAQRECREQSSQSYSDYERERQQLLQ